MKIAIPFALALAAFGCSLSEVLAEPGMGNRAPKDPTQINNQAPLDLGRPIAERGLVHKYRRGKYPHIKRGCSR